MSSAKGKTPGGLGWLVGCYCALEGPGWRADFPFLLFFLFVPHFFSVFILLGYHLIFAKGETSPIICVALYCNATKKFEPQ